MDSNEREWGLTQEDVDLLKSRTTITEESQKASEDAKCEKKMNNEELMRKGNVLIAAARDGKIGLSEDELKGLQKSYLRLGQHGDKIKLLKVSGISMSICGLFACMVGSEEGWLAFLFIIGGLVWFGDAYLLEQRARQYEELVEREYPKIDKKEAA